MVFDVDTTQDNKGRIYQCSLPIQNLPRITYTTIGVAVSLFFEKPFDITRLKLRSYVCDIPSNIGFTTLIVNTTSNRVNISFADFPAGELIPVSDWVFSHQVIEIIFLPTQINP
jgi:hypothetical protein